MIPVETGLLAGKIPFIHGGAGPRHAVVFFGGNALCKRLDKSSDPSRYAGQIVGILPEGYRVTILVLLRHEWVWCGGLRKWVAQHGHRSRLWARATVSLRRMVAIEFGTCRSGRIGGAAGSITRGKANRFELRGG